jgi:hypothetical protein
MKYRYKCTKPKLSADVISTIIDSNQMEDWLNEMDNLGWEFVGHAENRWNRFGEPFMQSFWIFRTEV